MTIMTNDKVSNEVGGKIVSNDVFTDFNRLRKSISALICARSYLDSVNGEAVDSIIRLSEKMETSKYVQSDDFIAVAGMQGTGKTTIISCLYGLPRDLLDISTGRSERIPVFISEDSNLADGQYRAERVSIDRDTGDLCREEMDVSKVASYSKGKSKVAFVELFVPEKYNAKFVLLPGFEKDEHKQFNTVYNSIMEYTLHFAKAVLLVVDDVGLANRDIGDLIDMLGEKFSATNCVFAVSKCDLKTAAECEELKETLFNECREHQLMINRSQIVCTYGEKNNDWHQELFQCIETNIDYNASKKNYLFFRPMAEEMCECANKIKDSIEIKYGQIEINDRPVIYDDLQDSLEETRREIKGRLDDICKQVQVQLQEDFAKKFDMIDKKVKRDKKYLFVKKTEGEKMRDRKIIRGVAEKCLFVDGENNRTHFIDKISKDVVGQIRSNSNEINNHYLNDRNKMISISKEGENVQFTKQNQEDAYKLVAYYFNKDVTLPNDITPDYKAFASIVATEFKLYYYGAITNVEKNANVYHSYDTIDSAMNNASKKKSKSQIAGAIALIDMLDGSPDIIKTVIELGEIAGVSAALPYVGVAVALAAVTTLGVKLYNDMIDAQNSLCNAWVYSLQGIVEDQKEACLDVYDDACTKLLEYICDVHKKRCNIDEQRYRLANARYSVENIFKLAADIDKQYAMSLSK